VPLPHAKRFDYAAEIGRAGEISAAGEPPLALPASLTPQHLVLAGVGRCTIASIDYHARRARLSVAAAASGAVTRRADDKRYAFVEIERALDVDLDPAAPTEALAELLAKAERDCFVGASLRVAPPYSWRIYGEEFG
jgi:uncharacterized OsmC-like protein